MSYRDQKNSDIGVVNTVHNGLSVDYIYDDFSIALEKTRSRLLLSNTHIK